jgi:hypothetical protein
MAQRRKEEHGVVLMIWESYGKAAIDEEV